MKRKSLNAVTLKRIFIIGIIPTLILGAGAVYFLYNMLNERVREANHARIDAEVSLENISQLRTLEKKLAENKDAAERAASIVAESKQYGYQDQIVNDINTYAERAGVVILGFDFEDSSGGEASEGSSTTSQPEGSSSGQAIPNTSENSSTSTPGNLKTVSATITLKNPVPLTDFLIFLKYIEQNVTKMQVTGVTLTPDSNPELISNPTINLTVYTR